MKTVLVSDIYDVTQISKSNDAPWKLMQQIMRESEAHEKVLFDFDGIELKEPWNNLEFKKLIADERVHIKVYGSEDVANSMIILCMSLKTDTSRIINADELIIDTPITENKNLKIMTERIRGGVSETAEGYELMLNDVIDQVGSHETVTAIKNVIDEHIKDDKSKKFLINTEYMFIQVNMVKVLAEMVVDYTSQGYNVDIISYEDETERDLKTYICLSCAIKLSTEAKVKIIKENLKPGTVGFLARYKDSKGKDMFGRYGNGEIVTSRPAIFLGVGRSKGTGKYAVKIQEFDGHTFQTRIQYQLDNDGERLKQPRTKNIIIDVDDIGIMASFVGSKYHFNLPIQDNINKMVAIYKIEEQEGTDEDGEELGSVIKTEKVTIPEFCKLVLDDFDIEYNREKLDEDILETKRILNLL